jgi:hypothetical protein
MVVARISVRVLGDLEIRHETTGGQVIEVATLTNRRARQLLVLLVCEPRAHSIEDLVHMFVSVASDVDRHDRNLIQQAVTALRRALGPMQDLLVLTQDGYKLERALGRLYIDVDVAAEHFREHRWSMAVAEHRGRLASGMEADFLGPHRQLQIEQVERSIAALVPGMAQAEVASYTNVVLAGQSIAGLLPDVASPASIAGRDVLVFARDMHTAFMIHGLEVVNQPGRLSGLVTSRKKTRDRLFLQIEDGTGTIQLEIEATSAAWESALWITVRQRVHAEGHMIVMKPKRGDARLTLRAHAVERRENVTASRPTSVYLARLANHFRVALVNEGYNELATKLLSSEWPDDGVEVLKVLYSGMGPGAFALAPSPLPQLISALVSAPFERAFAVAPSITPTYRDPHVSTESLSVTLVALDVAIDLVLEFVHTVALGLYADGSTAPLAKVSDRLERLEGLWPPPSGATGVDRPELQLFSSAPEGTHVDSVIARLCWPYEHDDVQMRDYVLAEGYTRLAGGSTALTAATINIERLMALLLERHSDRIIPALAEDA